MSSSSTYGRSVSAGMQVDYTINGLKPFNLYEMQVCESSLYFLAVTVNAIYCKCFNFL